MRKIWILVILILLTLIYVICIKTDNETNIKKNNILENRSSSKSILELLSDVNALSENEMIWENAPTQISTVINNIQQDLRGCGISGVTITKDDLSFIDSRLKFIKMLPISRLFESIDYYNIKCYVSHIDRKNVAAWIVPEQNIPQYLPPRNILIINNALYQTSPYGVIKYILPNLSKFDGNPRLNGTIEANLLNEYHIYDRNMEIIFPFENALIRKVDNQYFDLRTGNIYDINKLKDRVALLNKKIIAENSPSDLIKKTNSSESNIQNNKVTKKITAVTKSKIQNNKAVKKVATKIINTNNKNKSVIKKVKDNNLPGIKSEVKKILKKVSKAIVEKFEGFTSNEDSDENQEHDDLEGFTSNEDDDENQDHDDLEEFSGNGEIIFALEYDNMPYLFSNSEIIPYSNWAKKVNDFIAKGSVGIKTIIPHYYENNGKFNTRVIIVFDNDFYTILENNNISEVMDFKKDFSISFTEDISKLYTCDVIKPIIYNQYDMGVIDSNKYFKILNEKNCKY